MDAELKRRRLRERALKDRWLRRRETDAMDGLVTAIREIQGIAEIEYKKQVHGSIRVEGLCVQVRVTKNRSIYIFGEYPNVKRYLTLDDALDALTDHLAEAVARRM